MMFVNKSAAGRILSIPSKDVKEVRVIKGKVLVRYKKNKGNCCTFISFNAFKKDFLTLRVDAHLHNSYEIVNYPDVDNLTAIRALVKFENSNDSHVVEIDQGIYSCDCADFQFQKNNGNGFCRPVCRHLKPVSKFFGYSTFAECVKATKRQKVTF